MTDDDVLAAMIAGGVRVTAAGEWLTAHDRRVAAAAREDAIKVVESRANRVRVAATHDGARPMDGVAVGAWRALMAAVKDLKEKK